MTNKNITLIMTGNEGYGVKRVWLDIIKGLSDTGLDIYIILTENDKFKIELSLFNVKDIYCYQKLVSDGKTYSKRGKIATQINNIKIMLWLWNKLLFIKNNRIIFQNPLYVFSLSFLGYRNKQKVFWMMPNVISNSYPFDINKRLYRLFIKLSKLTVLPNSKYTDESLGGKGIQRKVIYPGVNYKRFKINKNRIDIRDEYNIAPREFVFCIAASLTKIKGHDIIIESFIRLKKQGIEPYLFICGGPLYTSIAEEIKTKINNNNLSRNIIMTGNVDNIEDYFYASDVVISATTIAEGFGLSIVEAMASGKPVLAHSLGAPKETIIHNKTGWLIDNLTLDNLCEVLVIIMKDKKKVNKMGVYSRERVEVLYSINRTINDLMNVIK